MALAVGGDLGPVATASPLPPITYIVPPSAAPAAALKPPARAGASPLVRFGVEALEDVQRPTGVADHPGGDVDLAADLDEAV